MTVIDMAGNLNDLMNLYQQMKSDPRKFFNLPQDVDVTNPEGIIQYLLNTGRISQAQVNNAMNMRNSPLVQRLMGR